MCSYSFLRQRAKHVIAVNPARVVAPEPLGTPDRSLRSAQPGEFNPLRNRSYARSKVICRETRQAAFDLFQTGGPKTLARKN